MMVHRKEEGPSLSDDGGPQLPQLPQQLERQFSSTFPNGLKSADPPYSTAVGSPKGAAVVKGSPFSLGLEAPLRAPLPPL